MPDNETWETKLEKILPLIVEDYNNFIIEAGEIGEMDIEEIWSERIKPLFLEQLTLARREERQRILDFLPKVSLIEVSGEVVTIQDAERAVISQVRSFLLSPTPITRNEEV